ncbi:MAG: hypothetical protein ABWX70_01445 [Hyphomicrobium sp.]
MTPYFRAYAENLNRLHLIEFIDHFGAAFRKAQDGSGATISLRLTSEELRASTLTIPPREFFSGDPGK